ncbi:MAG TPA: MBL fold metallo-hydrolase [bacterium]|nr:MBL fold metallo-hydrolase [bacterium]
MPRYENLEPTDLNSFPLVLKWALTRKQPPWPRWVDSVPGPPPPPKVAGTGLRATVVNHATVLLQGGGANLLCDPHWGERCSPVSWAGPKRVRAPGLRFEDLPPIHAVLISHNHYDHLDRPTLTRLGRAFPAARLVTGLGVGRSIPEAWDGRVTELDWWQSAEAAPGLRVTYVPGRHFSARGPFDRWASRWGGFVAEWPGGPVYFAGDTGYGRHFRMIRRRFGAMRLAVLPVGAYLPRWFMRHHHMDPADAVKAFRDLGADWGLGMHYGTFQLADEAYDAPLKDLDLALKRGKVQAGRFRAPEFGKGWTLGRGKP